MQRQEMLEFADIVAKAVVKALGGKDVSAPEKPEKTAYQKTEQLLFNYMGFKRIIKEKMQEIKEIRAWGVPKSCSVTEFVQKGGLPGGIVLEEESVDNAIASVQRSVEGTVQAVALIDRCMAALKGDPYYKILEMRYFEGRTQEDIAVTFGCNQATIARNKSRLVKELAMRLFPDQVVNEMIN